MVETYETTSVHDSAWRFSDMPPPTDIASTVRLFSAFDIQGFFAASSIPITSISGTSTGALVTLSSGLVLLYEGSDLGFDQTVPTTGTVSSISALDGNGNVLGTLTLAGAPLNFAEITTDAPLRSYLANPVQVQDAFKDLGSDAPSNLFGGNKDDVINWSNGENIIRGLDGDDVLRLSEIFSSQTPVIVDGGNGRDTLSLFGSSVDWREATLLSLEAITLSDSFVRISASQIGQGQIARDAVIRPNGVGGITIDQVEGASVNLSSFLIGGNGAVFGPLFDVIGTKAKDTQTGSSTGDRLSGLDGNDTLYGNDGNDQLRGGDGNDKLYAGDADEFIRGMDLLEGGAGNDTLVGGNSSKMLGGDGNDVYTVSNSTAKISELKGEGNDRVITSVDLDLSGGEFSDDAGSIERIEIAGKLGVSVTGTASNNRIIGNSGADSLNGADGNDRLNGHGGDDVLSGGVGADIMSGGGGSDRFVFSTGFGKDRIDDFDSGKDVIDLSGLETITSFEDLAAGHIRQVGRNVWIESDGTDVLILKDVSLFSLDADDFLF
jgi:Ca2+-binding RTX toxin-like protein